MIGETAENLVYDYHNKVDMERKEMMYIEFSKLLKMNKDGSYTQTLNTLWSKLNES